jgi:hypothetical protein
MTTKKIDILENHTTSKQTKSQLSSGFLIETKLIFLNLLVYEHVVLKQDALVLFLVLRGVFCLVYHLLCQVLDQD